MRNLPALALTTTRSQTGTAELALRDETSGAVVASVRVGPAEHAGFYQAERFVVEPDHRAGELPGLLRYAALREARLRGYPLLILDAIDAEAAPRSGVSAVDGVPGIVVAEVDQAAQHCFGSMSPELQAWVADNLFADELETLVRERCNEFHKTSFFRRTFDGTLTRDQYVESVSNNHQFVRWTTRLLGRIIAETEDRALRRHYVDHFNGEIDHDVLLENDLRHLGADVDYVKTKMAPNQDILQFMSIQESASAFYKSPVWFLAVPFAIESVSAFLKVEFIDALKRCVASWGIENPGRAVTFLSSHIHTDGGDDGHWEGTRKMISQYCRTEADLQRMSAISRAVLASMTRAYDYYGNRPSVENLRRAYVAAARQQDATAPWTQ